MPNASGIQWDARGNPFRIGTNGQKQYLSPMSAAAYGMPGGEGGPAGDPRAAAWAKAHGASIDGGQVTNTAQPGSSLFSNRGEWNPSTGQWDQSTNWNNIMSMAVGGLLTAGVANAIMSGGAVTAPAGGTVAATDVVPASAAQAGAAGIPTGATASGAATGAEAAGVPVAGSSAAAPLPGLAGGTGSFDSAGSWIPDAGTNATAPAADAAGSTPSWLNAAKAGGQLASDISAGRANGRVAESAINNNANKTATDLYREQIAASQNENTYGLNSAGMANTYGLNSVTAGIGIGNLDLAQKDYALAAPGKRAGNAVRGDILANAQDVNISQPNIPTTTISGGLRPSMFSADTRQLGGLLSSQALQQQQAGDTFAPLPKVPAFTPPPPYKPPPAAPILTGPSQANGFDTGLNIAGYAGLGADLLTKYGKFVGL
jgi:hypothetical protein